MIDYANKHGIPVPVTKAKPYSMDRNLLHISFEGGMLEDLWNEPLEDMFVLSCSPEKAPDTPTSVVVSFKNGDPVAVDGVSLSPANLLAKLNELGGRNGIGRVDIVENRYVGMKSRGVYETPGGTIMKVAHRAIEQITMDREVMHLRDELMPRYAGMVYNGFWFAPERELLQAPHRSVAAGRHRRCAGEALQGQLHRNRQKGGEVSLQPGDSNVRRG